MTTTTTTQPLSQRLTAPYKKLEKLAPNTFKQIDRISKIIESCSTSYAVSEKLGTSLTEIYRDQIYSLSEPTAIPFAQHKTMRHLKQIDDSLYRSINEYLALFESVAFRPFGEFKGKFQGDATAIMHTHWTTLSEIDQTQKERLSWKLKRQRTQNTMSVISQRFPIYRVQTNQPRLANVDQKDDADDNEDEQEEEEDVDVDSEDEDDEYSKGMAEYEAKTKNQQHLRGKLDFRSLGVKHYVLFKNNRIDFGTSPLRDVRSIITSVKDATFSYQELAMKFHGQAKQVRVERIDRKVCDDVIAARLNVYPLINEVQSKHDDLKHNDCKESTDDTSKPCIFGFLYIVYHDANAVFVHLTNEDGQVFGTRLNGKNIRVIPNLFVSQAVDTRAFCKLPVPTNYFLERDKHYIWQYFRRKRKRKKVEKQEETEDDVLIQFRLDLLNDNQ